MLVQKEKKKSLYWQAILNFVIENERYHKRPRFLRYTMPILLITIAIGIKLFFFNIIGIDTPFLFLTFIVLISSIYGGLGPGLTATIIGGFTIDSLFLTSTASLFHPDNLIRIFIYFIEGFLISVITESKQQTDKQKDEFIAFAVHEIKNPLTSI